MSEPVHILIIEDEENIQGILNTLIRRYFDERKTPVTIKAMQDAIAGLYELSTRGHFYDLVLLDVRLPKLSGDEIYNGISLVNPDLAERILFVTGYPDDIRERWPDKNFNILEKPFRYDTLAEKIASIIPG